MNRHNTLSSLLAAFFAIAIASCSQQVAGTNDETHTEVAARVVKPDGTPAVGASITLVGRDSTVAAGGGQVDQDGHPQITRPVVDGAYAMTASSGPLTSWTDSVKVVAGRVQLAGDDTLRQAGQISGVVLLQPNHDPQTITVNVLGTDISTNVGRDGRFTVPLLGAGVLRLRLATTLQDYTPLFRSVRLGISQNLSIPDTLRIPYTGIPVVFGLKAVNDSATGDILLSWTAADHPHVVGYLVYRDTAGSTVYSSAAIASTTSTSWRDVSANASTRIQTWRYRVAVQVQGSALPGDWNEVVQASSVPPSIAHLQDIHWSSFGISSGSFLGFLGSSYGMANLEVGTDSVRLPVWSSTDSLKWNLAGTASFPLRRMGQSIVRAAGFGAGRIWYFGRSSIGDGVEVSSSSDGNNWSKSTIPDSLWPGDANLSVIGSPHGVGLVSRGASSTVLVGDSAGNWRRNTIAGRLLGIDDSGIWTDGGARHIARYDARTARTVQIDLGSWSAADSLVAIVPWQGSYLLQAGARLWFQDAGGWSPRASSTVNALTANADKLLVRDNSGLDWLGRP